MLPSSGGGGADAESNYLESFGRCGRQDALLAADWGESIRRALKSDAGAPELPPTLCNGALIYGAA